MRPFLLYRLDPHRGQVSLLIIVLPLAFPLSAYGSGQKEHEDYKSLTRIALPVGMDVHKECIASVVLDGHGKVLMESVTETKAMCTSCSPTPSLPTRP
jgi:hypothetical protein